MTKDEKHKFYHSSAWLEKQAYIMRRDHNECQECIKRIRRAKEDGIQLTPAESRIRRADCVHHIRHLEDFPELALVDENLEAVCNVCHNRLHPEKMQKFWKNVKRRKPQITEEKW